jgi:hypothetical protein
MRGPPARVPLVSALVVALVAGGSLTGVFLAPAAASPQPTPLCPACGGQFERAAEERGIPVDVNASRTLVQVHENGSAT